MIITKPAVDILNDSVREYGITVVSDRALPSIVDGLKPTLRRAIYISNKYFNGRRVRVNQLAGRSMELVSTGDAGVNGAISLAAREWAGANNHALFKPTGAVGNRVFDDVDTIAAPRYLSVELSKFSEHLLIDSEVWDEVPNYDESATEIRHFLPAIPVCLINGSSGIAFGTSTNILPYKIKDLAKVIRAILAGDKNIKEPMPYFRGFKGTIGSVEPNKFLSVGNFVKSGKKEITVDELPIGMSRERFIKYLDKLEESGKIKSYSDKCSDEYRFIIKLNTDDYEVNDMLAMLKLSTNVSQNLNVVDENKKLLMFDSVVDMLRVFVKFRLGKCSEAKAYWIDYHQAEYNKYSLVADCIKHGIYSNKYKNKQSMMDRVIKLNTAPPSREDVEYAVNIPVYKNTNEGYEEFKSKADEHFKKRNEWMSRTPESIFIERLKELESIKD